MKHLTQVERYRISALIQLGMPKTGIAHELGRDRSTVHREIKRNSDGRSGEYRPELAQRKADKRHVEKNKRGDLTPEVRALVEAWLKKDYSPEQIKGRADLEGRPCVSHETIYKIVWKNKKKGGQLFMHLRTRGKKYQKRGDRQAGRGFIPNRVDIAQRPSVVDRKERIGDLEIDLVMGKDHKGALLTINDRVTGMLRMGHVGSKEAKAIEVRALELLEDWSPFIKTITSDNGKEFANHGNIAGALGIDYYFATPYHSWERGANENLNGLVGQYFPKGTELERNHQRSIREVEDILNNRPRKRHGYMTPYEVHAALINKAGSVAFIA